MRKPRDIDSELKALADTRVTHPLACRVIECPHLVIGVRENDARIRRDGKPQSA